MIAQFTEQEVLAATTGMTATLLKPRKAKSLVMSAKNSKGFAQGTSGFATGYPKRVVGAA